MFVFALLPVALAQPAAPPAMITLVSGPVTLVAGSTRTPAPPAPFLLPAGQSLDIGAGGHVVLLRQGGAHAVDGPRTLDPASLKAEGSVADAVGGLLDKRTSLASAGASRGGTLTLTRPVPQAPVLALGEVRWTCPGCGPQEVAIVDLREDGTLWTATGEGQVSYTGPRLAPGTYAVRVGGVETAFRVTPSTVADTAITAAHLDQIPDARDRAAALGGTLFLAGYPTDALAVLESAGLTDLVQETERLAGLHR